MSERQHEFGDHTQLRHDYQCIEPKPDYAKATLTNLHRLWSRPVHIETMMDDKCRIIGYDGTKHDITDKPS